MRPNVAVVGSANLDIVVTVPHHPSTGETVLGGDHSQIPGGKGANQAVAAARLGADVSFVGMIGGDSAGNTLRESLESAGVTTVGLGVAADAPSGVALITVDANGDNAITVSPGANALVSEAEISAHASVLNAAVTQLQLEIPMAAVIQAAQIATGIVVLDPAPAPPDGIPRALLDATDILVPNETELALLTVRSIDPTDVEDLANAARTLDVPTVVVTLGPVGAVIVTADDVTTIPAPRITPVDTTGAGDSFRSALSVRLASGFSLTDAARFAVRAGAATAMAFGAQPSLPTEAEIEERLQ